VGDGSQGVALGCHILAFQAARLHGTDVALLLTSHNLANAPHRFARYASPAPLPPVNCRNSFIFSRKISTWRESDFLQFFTRSRICALFD
jgi:hypothetical protein